MKHFNFFSTVLDVVMISSAPILKACSKQENIGQTTNPEAVYMNAADIQFQNNLLRFKDKVEYIRENPGFKSGASMEVDSVVWYLEALFNAVYAYPDEKYSYSVTDTATFQVTLDAEGLVSLNELSAKYDELLLQW